MQLLIDDQLQIFMPVQQFRQQWYLPVGFGVGFFEPKSWEVLGSIKGAGEAIARMKENVLADIPEKIPWPVF